MNASAFTHVREDSIEKNDKETLVWRRESPGERSAKPLAVFGAVFERAQEQGNNSFVHCRFSNWHAVKEIIPTCKPYRVRLTWWSRREVLLIFGCVLAISFS